MGNNTLIDYMRNNPVFRYVDFDRVHPVHTLLDARNYLKRVLGSGVIIAREGDVNVVKMQRGEVLRFTNEEVNAYFTVAYSSMTLEQKRGFYGF